MSDLQICVCVGGGRGREQGSKRGGLPAVSRVSTPSSTRLHSFTDAALQQLNAQRSHMWSGVTVRTALVVWRLLLTPFPLSVVRPNDRPTHVASFAADGRGRGSRREGQTAELHAAAATEEVAGRGLLPNLN